MKQPIKFSRFLQTILISIFLITLIAAYLIYKQDFEKKKIIFENSASKIPYLIENRMNVYKQVLLSGVAKFYSSENVTRENWKRYFEELKLNKNYPGIQGVGFSLLIKPKDKDKHILSIRKEGFPFYDIKPKGKRDVYTSIIYLEPFDDRNKRAFGYDMYSQEVRRTAMKRAIRTGEYSLSGKVHLLQENGIDVQAGFLAYIPVYKPNMNMSSFEERLDATYGFVYAPFRAKDLVTSIELDSNKYLDIEIYENSIDKRENLLYESVSDHTYLDTDFNYISKLSIGGETWFIKVIAHKNFFKAVHSYRYVYILIFGILAITFILILTYLYRQSEKEKNIYFNDLKALSLRRDLVLKAATIGTWEWTFKDNSLKWDKNMYHIYGIDESVMNKNLSDIWKNLIHKDYKSSVFNELFGAKEQNRELEINFWVKTTYGEEKFINSIAIIENDENEKPKRMVGINIDVTNYERNKQQLLQQKELIETQKVKFESIFKYSKDAIAIVDLETNFLLYNSACIEMMGFSSEELLKRNWLHLIVKENYDEFKNIFDLVLKDGYYENYEKTFIVKNNRKILLNLSIVLLPDKKRFLISAKNFTEIKKKERLIKSYVDLIDKNVITSSTDLKGIITSASEAFCKISGYKKDELIGKNHSIVRHPDMKEEVFESLWNTIQNNNTWSGELKNITKNGDTYWVKTTISPIFDVNDIKVGYTAIREDITDKKIIEKLSITDALTKLYNRRHFNEIFPKYIQSAKRKNEIICFALMDIDHFKQYNDTYGHQKGDEALKIVGEVLKSSVKRADDYCFRLGGEEFGILFKTDDIENGYIFVNNIRQNIKDRNIEHLKNSASKYLTISIGLTCLNANKIKNIDFMYKDTDELLYEAKDSGRNKVICNC